MADPETLPHATTSLEEELALAPLSHRRMVGSEAFVLIYQAVGAILGLTIGMVLTGFIPVAQIWGGYLVPMFLPMEAVMTVGGIAGWGIGLSLAQKRHQAKFLAGIKRRGTPDGAEVTFGVEAAGLRIRTARIDYLVAWEAILEITPSPAAWLVQVDLTTFLLLKRAFADKQAQRAFLADILTHVRPEVRERSPEAVAFAAEG